MQARKLGMLLLVVVSLVVAFFALDASGGEWIPCTPTAEETEIEIEPYPATDTDTVVANVTITFTTTGYHVADWGTVSQDGNTFTVDIQVEMYTGISLPMITYVSHTYELGTLPVGTYTFILTAWGTYVNSSTFDVTSGGANSPPNADFYWEPETPTTRDTVQFWDNSTDPDNDIYNWTWDFGDGNISYEQNPQHQYADDGTYLVNLTVTDDDGTTNTTLKKITILPIQYTLTASVDPPGSGTITLNPSGGTYDYGTVVTVTFSPP